MITAEFNLTIEQFTIKSKSQMEKHQDHVSLNLTKTIVILNRLKHE